MNLANKSILLIGLITGIIQSSCFSAAIDCEGTFTYNASSFSPDQQLWIEESAVRWNAWVGHRVVTVRPGPKRDLCHIDAGVAAGLAVGVCHHPSETIIIDLEQLSKSDNSDMDKAIIEGVVMHEIGHAIGYRHTDGNSLMNPYGGADFTSIDRDQCIRIGMCSYDTCGKP